MPKRLETVLDGVGSSLADDRIARKVAG